MSELFIGLDRTTCESMGVGEGCLVPQISWILEKKIEKKGRMAEWSVLPPCSWGLEFDSSSKFKLSSGESRVSNNTLILDLN